MKYVRLVYLVELTALRRDQGGIEVPINGLRP
jgi:hypothetical protein